MPARKSVGSVYLDSSAFIPLLDSSHSLHNKAVSYVAVAKPREGRAPSRPRPRQSAALPNGNGGFATASYVKTTGALPSIDAVVLSEVLAGSDPNVDRDVLADKYTKQFRVPSFDARAARVCSELFRILKAAGQIPSQKQDRQVTKADLMILATIMTNRASEFVFEDKHFTHYPAFLTGMVCGYALPKFTRLCEQPDVMVQTEIPGRLR